MPEYYISLIESLCSVLVGFLIALFSGCLVVECILDKVTKEIDDNRGQGYSTKEWKDLLEPPKAGGCWLGAFERIFFFFSFLILKPELLAVWLAFKAASKWDVWQNIIKVPGESDTRDERLTLNVRRVWGSRVMQRFLIGTLLNILLGLAGAIVTWVLLE